MNKELSEYERGVIDGRQIQMQSSVDKAVNAMSQSQRTWVGLTDEEVDECYYWKGRQWTTDELVRHVEAKLREKNNG